MANIQSHVEVYSKALNLRAQRHEMLASNIANADTPHYKARDFDFAKAMDNALAGRPAAGSLAMAVTRAGHIRDAVGSPFAEVQYRKEVQSAVDGNTVDMDVERVQIAENAMHYQLLTQLISDKFSGLRRAMSGTQG